MCTMIPVDHSPNRGHTAIRRVHYPGNGTLSVVRTAWHLPRASDRSASGRQGAMGVADGNRTMRGRILIVDDDTALSEMLSIVLRNEGYDTYLCATGDKAVPAFREFKPDLLLLDLMLPGMDGIDVCRASRAESAVPIVMLTASGATVDVVVG